MESSSLLIPGKVLLIPETNANQSAFAAIMTQEAKEAPEASEEKQLDTADASSVSSKKSYASLPELPEATPPLVSESVASDTPQEIQENTSKPITHGLHLKKLTHTVKHGESLSSIAKTYHISSSELAHWNNLSNSQSITPGKILVIWQKEKTTQTNTSASHLHSHFPASYSHHSSRHHHPEQLHKKSHT